MKISRNRDPKNMNIDKLKNDDRVSIRSQYTVKLFTPGCEEFDNRV